MAEDRNRSEVGYYPAEDNLLVADRKNFLRSEEARNLADSMPDIPAAAPDSETRIDSADPECILRFEDLDNSVQDSGSNKDRPDILAASVAEDNPAVLLCIAAVRDPVPVLF